MGVSGVGVGAGYAADAAERWNGPLNLKEELRMLLLLVLFVRVMDIQVDGMRVPDASRVLVRSVPPRSS